ncbi:feruloyl esterase [Faunimonas pinastri]|uniref:Feruloyl esterase n=1 Tax=Faunimonas pinastri TaxID=1855383 RepID=A0A1H9LE12_9HYPH|nr:tannase/feruloyl esterase family alpha/beta hydrolase [Faunimonas pinastri]SER09375.1 feruloyl esterase [Faunimonas pinastri]
MGGRRSPGFATPRGTKAWRRLFGGALIAAASGCAVPALAAGSCEDLRSLQLPHMTVKSASRIAQDGFRPPASEGKESTALTGPAFCRVEVEAAPTPDSQIGLEVWVPEGAAWNGKLLGVGNGGYSSVLDYKEMAAALRRGYAAVATDDGHQGEDLRFVIGHPDRIADWSDRSIHVMTDAAKLIVRDLNGRLPERSYFKGCSTGGFQAMAESQRYPADYDGIIAGAPGYARTNLSASFLWAWIVNHDAEGKEILTRPKLPLINKAVVAACDELDGVKDGLIGDPGQCHFDPATLLCQNGDADDCLTSAQVDVVRKVYAGPHDPKTGRSIFPGWDPGSEAPGGDAKNGWTSYIVGQPEPVRLELWKHWVFADPNFDWHSFDFDRDLEFANKLLPTMNATQADLTPFEKRGGKLLMYFGLADKVSSARTGIDYYNSVLDAMDGHQRVDPFYRLFLMPGVGHCEGGPGPDSFDALGTLESWVEHGKAPDRIVASHRTDGAVDRTRPLCPYPSVARYSGTGDTNDAGNFRCVADPQQQHGDRSWLTQVQDWDAQARATASASRN